MATKRRKADKLVAPQTTEAAIALLARFATLDAQLAASKAEVEAMVAAMRASADICAAPIEAEIKALFNQLKPWWAVASAELTEGKRKSIELGGCVIGDRMSNPSLGYPRPEDAAIKLLLEAGLDPFIRTKRELDKQQLIKFLGTDFDGIVTDALLRHDQEQLRSWGFKVNQKEEFFIDRIPPKESQVEVVPDTAQVAA